MTTAAFRNNILAVDSQTSSNTLALPSPSKLTVGKTFVFANAGDASLRDQFRLWLESGADALSRPVISYVGDSKPQGRFLTVLDAFRPDGEVTVRLYDEDFLFVDRPSDFYIAIGSGEQLAIGAMWSGCDAIQAVRCACKHNVYTGLPVRWINVVTGEKGVEHDGQ